METIDVNPILVRVVLVLGAPQNIPHHHRLPSACFHQEESGIATERLMQGTL